MKFVRHNRVLINVLWPTVVSWSLISSASAEAALLLFYASVCFLCCSKDELLLLHRFAVAGSM